MEIQHVLVLSTAHVSRSDMEFLSYEYASDKYSATVFVDGADIYGKLHLSKDIRTLANRYDCKFVKFDQDGPIEDGLKTFDW